MCLMKLRAVQVAAFAPDHVPERQARKSESTEVVEERGPLFISCRKGAGAVECIH